MKYKTYLQIDKKVDWLYTQKRYDEGIALLESARNLFPNRLSEILVYESILYMLKEDHERCLDVIDEALKRDYFMNLEWEVFNPVRESERFKKAFAANLRLRAEFQAKAKMTWQALLPEGYSPSKRHSLFIACHGNMSAIEAFKERWEPATMLEQGFVVVYIQSSQAICTNGFNWTDSWKKTREDIKACYDQVGKKYSIDPERVIVGGFSGGGIAAIEVTMANVFPVKGFIALCSNRKPESFTRQAVEGAIQRGVKAVMLHGELEDAPEEREMEQLFKETGFPCLSITNRDIAHDFPRNFPRKLSDAIKYVMS